jgi:RNA polymerase sigma factor (sigma-70 family)
VSDLLLRLRRREHPAQEQVYLAYHQGLKALAVRILPCAAEAESLVADVITDFLYRYVDTLQRQESIGAYMRMMTTRRARRRLEMQRRVREVDHQDMAAEPDLPAAAEGPKWRRWVDDCVAALAERPRQLLRLHFGHDLSLSEIGDQMGITKQAVSKTVLKSLDLLRRCLRGKGAPMP